MTQDAIIQLSDVWKIYRLGKVDVTVLRGVSLVIPQGEFISIMGRSGSGKSTLLNMVGVLDTPTRGTIKINGKDISLLSENELARIRGKTIGFVFQQFNLLHNLSALENVMLPMVFYKVAREERVRRATELLTLVGLKERLHHRPVELSGGEQQRIAIARALSNNPDVILADEPTGNLDTHTGELIMNTFVRLHKEQKKTIVVITHDQYIARYSKSTIAIQDGKIVDSLPPIPPSRRKKSKSKTL